MPISRREAIVTAVAGGASFAAMPALAASSATETPAVLSPLQRFIKLYASLQAGDIWYWYSGQIEIAEPGARIRPLVGIDTLIRRKVTPLADGTFSITTWEADYFHGIGNADPIDTLVNPATGVTVRPFHFREGPRINRFDNDRLTLIASPDIESAILWREAGAYTWLKRELHIDVPHPLNVTAWPEEASGPRNRSGSFSTHCALTRDMLDPGLASAPCSFNYEAVCGWFPWLLMGQRPGHLVWRANGLKLSGLADLPAESRRGFQKVFPAILTDGVPWSDPVLMWDDYQQQRKASS